MQRDFSRKDVKFFYIYKALAHPEQNGYITPFDLKERLMHVTEAKNKLGTQVTWICDTMDNDLKHALGNAPNSEFIIDPKGKIVAARQWSSPSSLRKDLETFVGKVEKPTTIREIGMKPLQPPKKSKTGIVKRIQTSGRMFPVIVKPVSTNDNEPYYVKLRAEADSKLLQSG